MHSPPEPHIVCLPGKLYYELVDFYPTSSGERTSFHDAATGACIHQMTSHPSINHPPYFLQSAFTPGNTHLIFTSYRTGSSQLFIAGFPNGDIRQLTGGAAIHPFSPALHPDGDSIFFVRGGSIHCIDRHSGQERRVVEFAAAQLGECSLDVTGEWVVAAVKQGGQCGLAVGRASGSGWHIIPFPRTVIHPQFHPLEPDWIEFAGDPAPRMHRVRKDGSGMECLYEHGNDEFVVHETFLGLTGDLIFTVWPFSLRRMDWGTREIRTICDFNAWHISADREGREIVCDSNHPDTGLWRVDAATGTRRQICLTGSSNLGTQWKTSRYALAADFAAAQSDAKSGNLSWMETATDSVYGPQWTHPHPAFSGDGRYITFSSDRTGHTQVYVVEAT